jgi:type II secretory pathway pseudopilin PulG
VIRRVRCLDRRGWTVLETVVVLVGLSMVLAIAMVAYSKYQERVYVRLCHHQQRTLQGQIESMNTIELNVPIEELFAQLVKAGLIQGTLLGDRSVESVKFNDPGFGDNSFRDYLILPGAKMVGCYMHGSPYSDEL